MRSIIHSLANKLLHLPFCHHVRLSLSDSLRSKIIGLNGIPVFLSNVRTQRSVLHPLNWYFVKFQKHLIYYDRQILRSIDPVVAILSLHPI